MVDRELIEKLSDEYEARKMRFEYQQLRNIYGKTAAERWHMAREYHLAEAAMYESYNALRAAKNI